MRDKTDKILTAALRVFAEKGYNESTTQEIANEAQVAEITIFRKFKTKQNLFVTTIQSIVMDKFNKSLMDYAKQDDTKQFLINILHDRLLMISKNQTIIRTLLSESLMGNLEETIDLPKIMIQALKKTMEVHFSRKSILVDSERLVRFLSGLLVSYIMWGPPVPYHKLPEEEKLHLIEGYVDLLSSCWES
ncbi:TetR/AcrR family transcriptional regulator [Paenibacillus sp. J5C_2022]|uniref:TetR/AcrR family transcriptional regulator n=1 Tax=Paenibacillus sp. J5C2022 TaxID=2977129 RepID=UPI0021D0FD21|nr:TetR/AcrR family transcriptional regulator [Paenibacillus sp. J5C2022]MCU6711548.1 TetR/AcrR family transcriptional regulator [Paenibacillus sp. J5C2022]